MKNYFITAIIVLITTISFAQKWEHTFGYPGTDESFSDVIEYYDNGYLLCSSYEQLLATWLIKTDINGEMIWEKLLSWDATTLGMSAIDQGPDGEILIASGVYSTSIGFWPIITKLNSCGEKVWCRVFKEDDYLFGWYQDVMVLENNDIIALAQFESLENFDQVYLDYIDADGNLLWRQVYASRDDYPHIRSTNGDEIRKYGDNYIIHGHCYYPYPTDTTHFYQRPLFIKLDSLFNEQWIIPFGVNDSLVGKALETLQLNDSTYMGTGMLRLESPVEHSLIMYFNDQGEELGYVEIPNDSIGPDISQNYLIDIERINDSLFIGLIALGIDDSEFFKGELIIDTTGKIYKQEFRPVGTTGGGKLVKSFDDKYTIACGWDDGISENDIYLYKINEELEHDTLYPGNYTYDSLCPGTIQSGVVDISNCMIITDVGKVPSSNKYYTNLNSIYIKAFPNPASEGQITFEFQNTKHHQNMELRCFNVFGKQVHKENVYQHQGESKVNVSSWKKGMYLAIVYSQGLPVGQCKFVVQ